jgi:lysophospholipase L1-like esterase
MNNEIIIVAFGDSITKGGNVAPHERFTSIAEKELAQAIGKQVKVINAGVNADVTALALHRIECDVLAHKPNFVTVMFGVNDAGFFRPDGPPADTPRVEPEDYRQNLHRMVEMISAVGAKTIFGTPLPMSPGYPLANLPQYKEHGLNYLVDQYAEIMREVAREHGIPLIDLHRAFADDLSTQAFLPDGIHPNMQGHAFIAKIYMNELMKEIKPNFSLRKKSSIIRNKRN